MPSHTISEKMKGQSSHEEEVEKEEPSNEIDFLINIVEGFIRDPKSVTTESLQDLLEGLKALREEESPMPEKEEMDGHKGKLPDLVIAIGRREKLGRKN